MKSLAIFGATGSIGASTLDLVRRHPDLYRASILTAQTNQGLMAQLAREFSPDIIVMSDEDAADGLRGQVSTSIKVLAGADGLVAAASQPYDLMVAAIVGFAGLAPTYQAVQLGKNVALANKEALVCAGKLIMGAAVASGSKILPIDSEHNAIFQCLEQGSLARVQSIQLTASGGPFRGWSAAQISKATLDQALRHPNWAMGPKVTIDSATLMNKALEMIEARWLFDIDPNQIQVVIHPQSIIHSCVTYADGSTLAQLGNPDMRTPIAYCLAFPERAGSGGASLNLTQLNALTFEEPDEDAFPTLNLARFAMAAAGPGMSIALNAVNEVLNTAVRMKHLPFGRLMPILDTMMQIIDAPPITGMAEIVDWDQEVRQRTQEQVACWKP